MDAVKPIDDVRGSARYRKLMVRKYHPPGCYLHLEQNQVGD